MAPVIGNGVDLPSEQEARERAPGNDEGLLETLQKDFDRLKRQKARPTGGVEGTTLTNLCMLNDEQWVNYTNSSLALEPKDSSKLYLTFNLISPRVNKLLGRLCQFNA